MIKVISNKSESDQKYKSDKAMKVIMIKIKPPGVYMKLYLFYFKKSSLKENQQCHMPITSIKTCSSLDHKSKENNQQVQSFRV